MSRLHWLRRRTATELALIVLGLAFVIELAFLLRVGAHSAVAERWFWGPLALQPLAVVRGAIWQIASYGLVHSVDGWGHILYNGLTLWFFGSAIERQAGRRALWKLLVGGVVAGGLVVCLVGWIAWFGFGRAPLPVVGVSGGVSAVILAWCLSNPRAGVRFWFVPMTAAQLLGLIVVMDIVRYTGGGLSLEAHVGGYLWGLFWLGRVGDPRRALGRVRLWWLRRRLRVIRGTEPRRDYLN